MGKERTEGKKDGKEGKGRGKGRNGEGRGVNTSVSMQGVRTPPDSGHAVSMGLQECRDTASF